MTFLNEAPDEEAVAVLDEAQRDAERSVLHGREVYSELDEEALGDGRFTGVGSVLALDATRRSRDVVTSGLELASS